MPNTLNSLKISTPKSLTELVIERLEQAIIDGEFGLGAAIPEEMLAKSFGVSRTPVRDALTHLQRQGLVVILNKRGSFVFEPTAEDATALCAYRFMLEFEALRLSLANGKLAAIEAMETALAGMEAVRFNALEPSEAASYGRADTAFHQAFFTHCGNAYVEEAYRLASGKVAALRTHLTAHVLDQRVRAFEEHAEMIELFRSGALDALGDLLFRHIDGTRRIYLEALSGPGGEAKRLTSMLES